MNTSKLKKLMEPPIEDPEICYYYARYVIRGKWPEAEELIMDSPPWDQWYINCAEGNIIRNILDFIRIEKPI